VISFILVPDGGEPVSADRPTYTGMRETTEYDNRVCDPHYIADL